MITMETKNGELGKMGIAGTCSKIATQTAPLPANFAQNSDDFHLTLIGKLIENNESLMRNEVTDTYINR